MISRVSVDHAVHIASGNAPKQIGLAQNFERLGALPVGLGNDADPEALRFQHPPDHGHAKARVVNIRVAGNDDDVAAVPAERVHLGPACRQEFGRAEPRCPVLAVAG